MRNFNMTVRADCTVSAHCPLPSPIKTIPRGLSVGDRGQPSDRSPTYPLVAGIWNKVNSPLHFPCGSAAMWETWVWSLGWEDPLEKGKTIHSSILAWRIHGLYSPWRVTKSQTGLSNFHFHSPFHQPCFFIDFWGASSQISTSGNSYIVMDFGIWWAKRIKTEARTRRVESISRLSK